jgi:predicted DCC family thiol-disulfide oxidoreductase YuxK
MGDAHPIILFDGVCNLCDASVQFILRRDPAGQFRFASLQSTAAQRELARFSAPPDNLSTVVLILGNRLFVRSDAALEALRRLGFPWPLFYLFKIVPRGIRDAVYDFIAARRYRWFGQKETCMVPTADLKARFLE